MTTIIYVNEAPGELAADDSLRRLRVRRVDLEGLARSCADLHAAEPKHWHIKAAHGGTVANRYNHPAQTEGAVAVCDRQGRVVVWGPERMRANKTTLAGVCRVVLPFAADIFDKRIKPGSVRDRAAWEEVKLEHRREVVMRTAAGNALVRLGGHDALARLTVGELEGILASPGGTRPAAEPLVEAVP